VLVLLGAGWLIVVSPERKQASKLQGEVNSASSQLSAAEGQLSDARSAHARYGSAYASVVRLGKAVPPAREVPGLVYQLALASNQTHVDFSSIVNGASGSSGGSSATGKASSAASSTALAGFTQMPFTFVFNGNYFDLERLFRRVDNFVVRTNGEPVVRGRLLTIQSAKLAPAAAGSGASVKSGEEQLTGTITATAYVLPPSQGLTAGASAAAPSGVTVAPSGGASTSSGASSPTAPAVARVSP
jgi:hypothetical protein